MEDPVVIVLPAANGWQVAVEGTHVREAFAERYSALECAHRWAQAQRPSLVRIVASDGAVEDEWAYGAFRGRRLGRTRQAARP
jgi:hypothetical protein